VKLDKETTANILYNNAAKLYKLPLQEQAEGQEQGASH
jgi:hypothetical protein